MGRGWALGIGVVVAGVLTGACSTERERPKEPVFSAESLGEHDDEDLMADLLSPEQREAVARSGMSKGPAFYDDDDDGLATRPSPAPKQDEPKGAFGRAADTAGKVGVALLSVGVTLGALAAPFFAF